MKNIIYFFLFYFLSSCNSAENGNGPVDSTAAGAEDSISAPVSNAPSASDSVQGLISGCYQKVTGRDTIILDVQESNGNVTGTLRFKNYQKDSSRGTVKGKKQNDLLLLWYEFFSEGMHSVMQVAFKPTSDGMLMGTGDVRHNRDSVYFKNISALQFSEDNKLIRINCSMKTQ